MKNRDTPARPSRHGDQVGLTKREECAMRFMQILVEKTDGWGTARHIAQNAVLLADALFDELEKGDE